MEAEINDAEIVGLLASPLSTQEREASADEPRICHSESADESRICHSDRENSGQRSSSVRSGIGKPMPVLSHWGMGKSIAVFSHERKSGSEEGEFAKHQEEVRKFLEKQNSIRELFLKNERITYSHKNDTNACGRKGGLTDLNHRNNIGVSNFLRIPQEMEELKKAQNWKWRNFLEKIQRKSERCNITYSPNSGIARRSILHD